MRPLNSDERDEADLIPQIVQALLPASAGSLTSSEQALLQKYGEIAAADYPEYMEPSKGAGFRMISANPEAKQDSQDLAKLLTDGLKQGEVRPELAMALSLHAKFRQLTLDPTHGSQEQTLSQAINNGLLFAVVDADARNVLSINDELQAKLHYALNEVMKSESPTIAYLSGQRVTDVLPRALNGGDNSLKTHYRSVGGAGLPDF